MTATRMHRIIAEPPPQGARVRVLANDAGVRPGTEGTVGPVNPDSGLPIVVLDAPTAGGARRPVALRPEQLHVLAVPPADGHAAPEDADPWAGWESIGGRPGFVTFGRAEVLLSGAAGRQLPAGTGWCRVLIDAAHGRVALVPCGADDPAGYRLIRANGTGRKLCCAAIWPRLAVENAPRKRARFATRWDERRRALIIEGVPFAERGGV